MLKRNEVDDKYKWDLSSYVKDEQELENNFNYLKQNMHKFKDFYGKLGDKQTLVNYLNLAKEFDIVYYRTGTYIYNVLNQDTSNTKYLNYQQRMEYIAKDCGEITAYVYPQMLEFSEEYINELLSDKSLYEYHKMFKDILRDKAHKVSEYDAQFLSKMSLCFGTDSGVYDTLTNGEIKFDSITGADGKIYEVNEAEYSKLMDCDDRLVRERALKSLMNGYGGKIRTCAQLYTNDIQHDIFMTKLHKFDSLKQSCLYDEEVDLEVYDKLITNINSRLNVLHQIVAKRAQYLNIDDVAYYDLMTTIGIKQKYSIEQAVDLVKEATLPLGDEYRNILKEKFEQNVIDYLPNENKQTGAYSTGFYGCPSIVLMNFVEDYNSVSTLAHEIGHAMHTEFSDRNQPMQLSNYVIFVAEVASTVNEILLNLQVAKNSDEQGKTALAFKLLDNVRTTIYRQTLFSEFEDCLMLS